MTPLPLPRCANESPECIHIHTIIKWRLDIRISERQSASLCESLKIYLVSGTLLMTIGPCSCVPSSAIASGGRVMKVSTIEGTRMVMGADVLRSEAPTAKAAEHMAQRHRNVSPNSRTVASQQS
jgi:hypothetical protein